MTFIRQRYEDTSLAIFRSSQKRARTPSYVHASASSSSSYLTFGDSCRNTQFSRYGNNAVTATKAAVARSERTNSVQSTVCIVM